MPKSYIKILDTVVFGIPRSALVLAQSDASLCVVDCGLYTVNILRGSACGRPSRMWITFSRFFEAFVPCFYLCCTHCIIPESLLNRPNSFHYGMLKCNTKFDADSLSYLLSHFECHSHTVHMLIQWCLVHSLTTTAKLSLFMHVHSSPLSLAARLHRCHANHSYYINSGWTFSAQTSYIHICTYIH